LAPTSFQQYVRQTGLQRLNCIPVEPIIVIFARPQVTRIKGQYVFKNIYKPELLQPIPQILAFSHPEWFIHFCRDRTNQGHGPAFYQQL
jgi:hypothetical protein